jgi:hypothetical protein
MSAAEREAVRLIAAFDRWRAGLREFQRAIVRLVAASDQAQAAVQAMRKPRA